MNCLGGEWGPTTRGSWVGVNEGFLSLGTLLLRTRGGGAYPRGITSKDHSSQKIIYVKTHQGFCSSHIQRLNVHEDSDQNADL